MYSKRQRVDMCVQELSGSRPAVVLESDVDAAEWNLEVERVLPQLKVSIRTDNKVSNTSTINHSMSSLW